MSTHDSKSESLRKRPLAYLITFRTYGTWLHGDRRGSVTRERNAFESPLAAPDQRWEMDRRKLMKHPPFALSKNAQSVVMRTLKEVCRYRGWTLLESDVRSNHVHVVLNSEDSPEIVMTALKSYSTRRLREADVASPDQKIWSRHGSTIYLWKERSVTRACEYVSEHQGSEAFGDP